MSLTRRDVLTRLLALGATPALMYLPELAAEIQQGEAWWNEALTLATDTKGFRIGDIIMLDNDVRELLVITGIKSDAFTATRMQEPDANGHNAMPSTDEILISGQRCLEEGAIKIGHSSVQV